MSIHARLSESQQRLTNALGLDGREARFEARLLMQESLKVDHAWLLAHEADTLDEHAAKTFAEMLARRLSGEPMAYILGYREFYGLKLQVSPATLIPRPDTETLVESALTKIGIAQPAKILDLGTGSGAVALAIASQRPLVSVIGVDFSEAALQMAICNAEKLHLENVQFLQSDWFSKLVNESFDVIVSNPPYIADKDAHLSQGDLRFEPLSALASGSDGLTAIKRIIAGAPRHMNQNSWLMLEHGYDQAAAVADLLNQYGFVEISHHRDLAQIVRVTSGHFI